MQEWIAGSWWFKTNSRQKPVFHKSAIFVEKRYPKATISPLPPSSPLKGLTIRHRGCRIQNPLTSCLAPGKAGLDVVFDKSALLGWGDRAAAFIAGGGGGSGAAGQEFAFISPVEPTWAAAALATGGPATAAPAVLPAPIEAAFASVFWPDFNCKSTVTVLTGCLCSDLDPMLVC